MKTRCRQQLTTSTAVAVLSTAFVASLLASTPRSDALIARPSGLLQPLTAAAAARAASVRGESPSRGATRRFACVPITLSAGATSSAFCSLRPTPISPPRRCGCRGGLSIALDANGDDHGPELEGEDGVVEGTIVGEIVEVEEARQGVQKTASTVASIPTSRRSASGAGKSKKTKKGARARLQGDALRDELIRRERAEEDKVLAVNTQFYRARAYKEIDDLKEVWDESELSECIRNAGAVLRGYDDIIEEYKTEFMLAKKQEKPGLRPFKVRDLKVQTSGTLAWVTCTEDMRNPYKPYPKTVQLVTNVFRKSSKGWRLIRHHASDRDMSINRESGGSGSSIGNGSSGISLSSLLGDKMSNSDGGGQSGNSLLSHFVDENGQVTQVSARMFRVSDGEIRPVDISELTGRGDGDDGAIISGEVTIDDDDEDDGDGDHGEESGGAGPLPQWLRKMIQDKVKAMDKKDLKDIMRRRQGDGISGGIEVEAESLEEGVHWEYRDGLPVILDHALRTKDKGDKQRWTDGRRADGKGKRKRRDSKGPVDVDVDDNVNDSDGSEEEDDREGVKEGRRSPGRSGLYGEKLTRETVEAVKKLAQAGKIKEREKQLLLAHVIRTASWYSPSNIEMALEVLMHHEDGEDLDVVECEEFVDQCKAYATELAEDQKRLRRRCWWKFWSRG